MVEAGCHSRMRVSWRSSWRKVATEWSGPRAAYDRLRDIPDVRPPRHISTQSSISPLVQKTTTSMHQCPDTASRARIIPEGLLGRREIEKDFPALVEVLKRFLDFVNRIDRGHRNGQRAGGDEGSCLDLRGEHLGDMVVVA